MRRPVGIFGLQAGEDVKGRFKRSIHYGIGTDSALEVPTSLVAVMLRDCRRWTRSPVVFPFDKVKGIVTRKLPPKPCEAGLWDHAEDAELTSIVR